LNLVNFESIESINGKDAHAVKKTKTTFYDVASGLKVAESKVMEQGKA
jgi:hypothetical protein